MLDNIPDIDKDIELELVETALLCMQQCQECGFIFFIEFQEGDEYYCPNCLEAVAYSEDHVFCVLL